MAATIVRVEQKCCFQITFLLSEVVKINLTCPREFKMWAQNVTCCFGLNCGRHPQGEGKHP